MYFRHKFRPKQSKRVLFKLFLICLLAAIVFSAFFLKELSTQMAVSNASDIVTAAVNDAITEMTSENDFGSNYFVEISRDDEGNVVSVSGNMANINAFSSQLLNRVIKSADSATITVNIPLGNLTGSNLLLGKGPDVVIDIVMLTSSRVDYKSEINSLSINQSDYKLYLDVSVDIDVLIPWGSESTTVVTQVLIADTVIVGKVPETYFNMEK